MATNVELERFLKPVPGFRGAHPEDVIEAGRFRLRPGESAIFNYSRLADGGTHWVAARFELGGHQITWFDSLDFEPDGEDPFLGLKTHFHAFLAKHGAPIVIYDPPGFRLQDLHSSTCGLWCAAFIAQGAAAGSAMKQTATWFWEKAFQLRTSAERDALVVRTYGGILRPPQYWVKDDVKKRLRSVLRK